MAHIYVVSGMRGHSTRETLARKFAISRDGREIAWAVDADTAHKIAEAMNTAEKEATA